MSIFEQGCQRGLKLLYCGENGTGRARAAIMASSSVSVETKQGFLIRERMAQRLFANGLYMFPKNELLIK